MTERKHRDSEAAAPSSAKPLKQRKTLQTLPKHRHVGNFKSYYSYRLGQKHQGELEDDPRVAALDETWIKGKRGLDIGCNSGELTITIAKRLAPSYFLGVDVDSQLISKARGLLKDLLRQNHIEKAYKEISSVKKASTDNEDGAMKAPASGRSEEMGPADKALTSSNNAVVEDVFADNMPVSFKLWKPSLKTQAAVPRAVGKSVFGSKFPLNVIFKQEDVVSDAHAGKDYDFILCFSLTKWIHLFYGDEGIDTVFKKMYELLVPGGRLILEPQPWKSYHKRKFTSEVTAANYPKIRLRPKDFPTYLVDSIGFRSCELIEVCQTSSKGFRRPIYVALK